MGVKCHLCNSDDTQVMRNIRAMQTPNDRTPNKYLADLVRTNRAALGMTQADLGEAVGKSRQWVLQVEKGAWTNGGKRVTLSPDNAIKLGLALGKDIEDILLAGEVPAEEWPDLSHISSNQSNLRLVDITSLTERQQVLIESIVDELKRENTESDRP